MVRGDFRHGADVGPVHDDAVAFGVALAAVVAVDLGVEDLAGIVPGHGAGDDVGAGVVLSQSGLTEMVYNDFYVGDDCDVTIVAGCGIHNSGDSDSRHDGLHSFYIGKNSHVKYVEKHPACLPW